MSEPTTGLRLRGAVRNAWNTLHTVYYANEVSWRALKTGGLVVFGFFLWAGSNVLLSYQPGWTFLHYTMAYGFLLVGYGPFHHLVVIPLSLRLRKRGGTRSRVGKHLPNAGLAAFLVAVVVLGTFPVGPVTANFQSSQHGTAPGVSADVQCVRHPGASDGGTVHCTLSNAEGVGRVVVRSGGKRLTTVDSPPFEFTIRVSDVQSTAGQRRFRIVVEDENGAVARQYTRRVSMLETATG
ncbi:MAG: hypothetical protein ABEJ82_06270 [Haloplanus sp.]